MSLIACPECTKQVSSFAPNCPGCGCPIKASGETKASEAQRVTIEDVHMEFGSMVVFMIKWAIAVIPAAIILVIILSIVAGMFAGGISSLLYPNS